MIYKKLYKVEYDEEVGFEGNSSVEYVDYLNIDINDNTNQEDEQALLQMMNVEFGRVDRPFNKIVIWGNEAIVERKHFYGGTDHWKVSVVYVLEIEGKKFLLTELEI